MSKFNFQVFSAQDCIDLNIALNRVENLDSKSRDLFIQEIDSSAIISRKIFQVTPSVSNLSGSDYHKILQKLENHSSICLSCLKELDPALSIVFYSEFIRIWSLLNTEFEMNLFGIPQPDYSSLLSENKLDEFIEQFKKNLLTSIVGFSAVVQVERKNNQGSIPPGYSIKRNVAKKMAIHDIQHLAGLYLKHTKSNPAVNRQGVFHEIVRVYLTAIRDKSREDCYTLIREALPKENNQ